MSQPILNVLILLGLATAGLLFAWTIFVLTMAARINRETKHPLR